MIGRWAHQPGPRALAALVAGGVAALGFEPVGWGVLTLLGLAALVWLCEAAPRRAALTGWLWGLAHFAVGVHWIAQSFTYQAKMPAELGWLAVIGLSALLATMPALACWAAWRFARTAAARAFLFPVAWMATEWMRGWLFTGFPWNPLAASTDYAISPTSGVMGLMPLAAGIGALGVSGLLAIASSALALQRTALSIGLIAVFSVFTSFDAITEFARLVRPTVQPASPQLVIVQPNIGQSEKWNPAYGARDLATLIALSRSAPPPAPGVPRLILWPEVAIPTAELETDAAVRATLAALLRPGDLLLTGGLAVTRDATGTPTAAANSLFVIDSNARIAGRYDKHHLVPGGEYVPLKPLADALGLSRLAPGELGFTPGPGPRTLRLPGLPAVGPMICYEMIFAARIVERRNRPAWLLNPSNDAWFGGAGPPQHLALARLRAIEEGLPIARSTPTGVSALIDARGRLIATIPQNTAAVITAPLPGALAPTPFARFGHLTTLALALVLAALAWRADRREVAQRARAA